MQEIIAREAPNGDAFEGMSPGAVASSSRLCVLGRSLALNSLQASALDGRRLPRALTDESVCLRPAASSDEIEAYVTAEREELDYVQKHNSGELAEMEAKKKALLAAAPATS